MTTTPSPNSDQTVIGNGNLFTATWYVYLQAIFKAIRAKFKLNLSGIISVDTTAASNSGSGETDLITYTVTANTLENNGDIVSVKAWGVFAANANNKTLKLKFGSQTILTTGAVAANDGSWEINATIIRKTPTTQEITASITSSNTSITQSSTRTAGTQDLTTDVIIKCTGQGTSTTDLTEDALVIGLTPND